MARIIEIEDTITVGMLAEKLDLPVTKLIGELFKNGIMATVNERIDFDTAQIIVGELNLDVELARHHTDTTASVGLKKAEPSKTASVRPPVVAVMGHVDHGKTSLLDAIRGASVAAGEAGGITQHISAYQIRHGDRAITFLDTPGHEAFGAIRQHGAHLTDIAIILVAADDGIKPQTLEAIRYARNAGTRMIVAINKIDKEGADVNRVKQQLAEQNMLVEEWGGDTVVVEVSAKTGKGISELLDMILLVADVEDLKADTDVPAEGLIIESRLEQGRGPVANALVEAGVINSGDFLVAGGTYAKVRVLQSTSGEKLSEAGPSTPVVIAGFKEAPAFGDRFVVVPNEKTARQLASDAAARTQRSKGRTGDINSSELMRLMNRKVQLQDFNIIVRADVQGSLTSVVDSLKSLETDEVSAKVIASGVGSITESDVQLAATSNAVIYGFNVAIPASVRRSAAHNGVQIHIYNIIYELLDDVREKLSALLSPEVIEAETGRLVVKAIFKTTKTGGICGGEVTKGKLNTPSYAKVFRDGEQLAEIEITDLRRGPQVVKEVLEGDMCGVGYAATSKLELQEGDRLEFFTRTVQSRTL